MHVCMYVQYLCIEYPETAAVHFHKRTTPVEMCPIVATVCMYVCMYVRMYTSS